ncbi:MAG: Gfo/Idh/MocA family protein [Planctomycetota bacterium]
MYLTPEMKDVGKVNFNAAIGSTPVRREFLMEQVRQGLASKSGLGAYYFGYENKVKEPVRVGVIGTGDEGSVLIGALNPDFMQVKAIADIRPYNVWRAFNGDYESPTARLVRPGLMKIYDWKTEDEAHENVKIYGDYSELIKNAKDDGIEAVIIGLPLHLHAPCAIAAMQAGLHVITEKLMAHSVRECKEMALVAKKQSEELESPLYLAVGHQRHYNILYNNAVELIRKGTLGDLHYIRAQWHRGNLPGRDSWQMPLPKDAKPGDRLAGVLEKQLESMQKSLKVLQEAMPKAKTATEREAIRAEMADLEIRIVQKTSQISDKDVDAAKYGYEAATIGAGEKAYDRPAIEELIRWRLWNRTGGGLMAELGSHQLDAASIFIAAVHGGEKQIPLSVSAAGNRPLFPRDRDIEDHVYCVFEFPAPGYDPKDSIANRKKIGVQYASINGNGFGGYGETVLGTSGTLVLETEKDAMLWKAADTLNKTHVVPKDGDPAALETWEPGDVESAAIGQLATLPAERGYAEELEHFAWCIRNPDPENQPRCTAKVALGDAVIALTTNMAARKGARIDFKHEWFEIDSEETPEGDKPDISRYKPVV